jgi:hypothetical protein
MNEEKFKVCTWHLCFVWSGLIGGNRIDLEELKNAHRRPTIVTLGVRISLSGNWETRKRTYYNRATLHGAILYSCSEDTIMYIT